MKSRLNRIAWICVSLCVLIPGCSARPSSPSHNDASIDESSGDETNAVQQTGTLRVLVTDKPFPFEFITEALVTITRVEVHRVGADANSDENFRHVRLQKQGSRASRERPDGSASWTVVNDGHPIDAGESLDPWRFGYFTSITNDSGDLIYLFHSPHIGTVMGRFSAAKTWDLWSQSDWSNAHDTVATAIDHAMGDYKRIRLYNHPDIPDGLLGVASQGIRSGTKQFNVHGFPSNFRFDGHDFQQWRAGIQYDILFNTSLIRSFGVDDSDFAYDPVKRTGILVGTIGYALHDFYPQLTATQYRNDDPTQRWHRWGPDGWHTTNSWPGFADVQMCRDVFILDRDAEVTQLEHKHPRITHLPGTEDYLVTFEAVVPSSGLPARRNGASLKACRYNAGATPRWTWWNGTTWEQGGSYNLAGIGGGTEYRSQRYWYGNKVVILLNDDGALTEITYDDQEQAFTEPTFLHYIEKPGRNDAQFCLAVDSNQTLWLAYADNGGTAVLLRHREAGADWSAPPETVLGGNSELSPVGLDFVGPEEQPVVFVAHAEGDYPDQTIRLLAVAEKTPFWDGEVPRVMDPMPPPVHLNESDLTWLNKATNTAPGMSYIAGTPGSMGIDRDGYAYTGQYGNTAVVVHPPDSTGTEMNRAWGNFWDHFSFPGGAAVDDQRGKVYITDRLVAGGGGTLTSDGCVKIWERKRRDESCGWAGDLPEYFNREYYPTVLSNSFAWPADVAVDEERGFLYVTNGLKNKVDVFDIEHVQDLESPFSRDGLFESGIPDACTNAVRDLVAAMINTNYLSDGGELGDESGTELTWVNCDLEGEVIPFLKRHQAFGDLGTSQDQFLRNVHKQYKEKNDRPVYLYSFGHPGAGDGEFTFPQGIDVDQEGSVYVVDCENHRIQKWDLDESGNHQTFAFAWGGLGRDPGEFLYPLGLALDDAHGLVYVTDPLNARVQVFNKEGGFRYEWGAWDEETTQYLDDRFGIAPGIAVDERGYVLLGTRTELVRFRVPDTPLDPAAYEPWVTIFEGKKVFDLLQLRNGRTALLADTAIPVGTYNRMRLVVAEGQITLTDGRRFPLRVPSGAQTGIKLRLTFDVEVDQETALLLDIDSSRAFKAIPSGHINDASDIRNFTFSPSLGTRLIRLADAGGISGSVTDIGSNVLPVVSVVALGDGIEVTSTATDERGLYSLSGLPAGTYRVEFSARGFEDTDVPGVVVSVGETTEHVDVVMRPTSH